MSELNLNSKLKNKINVLFVIIQMAMGGSERLVHTLIRNLDRNIFNPSLVWFHGDRVLKEFSDLQIPLYHIPKRKRIDLSAMGKIAEIIRKENIHIVNAHHFFSFIYVFYGSKIANNVGLIYTEHSEWELENISWKWRVIGRSLFKRVDSIVGVSTAVADHIKIKFKASNSKTVAIRNGVDLKSFSADFDRARIKRSLGLSEQDKIIGIVANLKKVKNHIFLLNAFAGVVKELGGVKLLLIGQGSEQDPENTESELKRFVHEKNLERDVMFLGYRSDIPELLSIMDVYCLTSLKEGLPISLIEAMAAGLPSVGTDVEGIRDVIVPRKTGFIVKLCDGEGLKSAILTLLADEQLARNMSLEALSLAKEKYSMERCTKNYTDLFLNCRNIRYETGEIRHG